MRLHPRIASGIFGVLICIFMLLIEKISGKKINEIIIYILGAFLTLVFYYIYMKNTFTMEIKKY